MRYRLEALGDLPQGYNQKDYFLDGGDCLNREYETREEAISAWEKNYKGPDSDGVGLVCNPYSGEWALGAFFRFNR